MAAILNDDVSCIPVIYLTDLYLCSLEFFLKFEAELDSIQLPEKEKQIDKDGR